MIILNYKKGFGLIEIVIGAAIIAIFLGAAINFFATARILESNLISKVEAQYLAEEGVEAMRLLRDQSWTSNVATLTLGSAYYLSFNGTNWQTTALPNTVNGKFYRTVTVSAGYRDGNDDIASSGTSDPDLRKMEVKVDWPTRSGTSTTKLIFYLTNLFDN